MTTETHDNGHYGPPPMDVFISLLGAIVIGAVIWAGGFGTVLAINYGGEMLGIYPPANPLINTAIQIGYMAVPILAGVAAAWFSYRFLLNLD
jgi:hypothetical protein